MYYPFLLADPEFQQQRPVFYKDSKPKLLKQVASKPSTKQHKPKFVQPNKYLPDIAASDQYHKTVETLHDDLRSKFTEELLAFVNDQDKQTMDYPTTLSSLQRKVLHEVC